MIRPALSIHVRPRESIVDAVARALQKLDVAPYDITHDGLRLIADYHRSEANECNRARLMGAPTAPQKRHLIDPKYLDEILSEE